MSVCHEHEDSLLPQAHSLQFLEMAFRTDKHRIVKHPDGYGKKMRECGDTVEMFLTVRHGQINSVFFQLQGCLNTNACVNALACLAEGKTVAEAWQITPQMLADSLVSLPADHFHCAQLAVSVFRIALADYESLQQNTWKKSYR